MTTRNIEDIAHKRFVSTKYMPNSYRIFCEEIGNNSMSEEQKYQSQAPSIYTQPMIVPAQAIEDRNHPHAGRQATFLRENARTLNEPVAKVTSKNVQREAERRWWEWNTVHANGGSIEERRKRSQSTNPSSSSSSSSAEGNQGGFQTTYQKDHGYLKEIVSGNAAQNGSAAAVKTGSAGATRHGANPNAREAIGIVPVNDLNGYSRQGEEQRVFVDKMSFDHQYDSRKDTNYPIAGKRQGAFVLDQVQPRSVYGLKARRDSNNGASIWELMQPMNQPSASGQRPPIQQQRDSADVRNQRRDPIGYFSDMKYGDEFDYGNKKSSAYQPSWESNGATHQPIAINGEN